MDHRYRACHRSGGVLMCKLNNNIRVRAHILTQ